MSAIPNARREMFSRLLAAGGKTQLQCYVEAGFSENGGASAASILAREPIIVERVQELLEFRKDRGIIPQDEIDLTEIVTGDKINEEWILRQLQDLIQTAKSMGQLKVAKDSIADIASIKGIGVQNQTKEIDNKNDNVPRIGKIDITVFAQRLAEAGSTLDKLLDEAVDVTPEPDEVLRITDGDLRQFTELDSYSALDRRDADELQREVEASSK
jgi:hypothetical protein